jgi:hypothetical protein
MNFTGMLGAHKMRIWLLCSALKYKCNTSNITQIFEFCFSPMPFDVKLNLFLAIFIWHCKLHYETQAWLYVRAAKI